VHNPNLGRNFSVSFVHSYIESLLNNNSNNNSEKSQQQILLFSNEFQKAPLLAASNSNFVFMEIIQISFLFTWLEVNCSEKQLMFEI